MEKYDIEAIKATTNIIDVISGYIELKKTGANYTGKCPFHNEKSGSFTVSAQKNMYKCFGCGKSGDSIQFLIEYKRIEFPEAIKILAEKYNFMPNEIDKPKISHFKPFEFKSGIDMSKKLLDWFAGRKIGKQTILDMGVTEGLEWMPQTKQNENTIHFNYLIEDKIVNTKYRDGKKNFKLRSGAKLVMYNLNCVKNHNEIIIVEGEIDALSLHEAGFLNVISVPNGAGVSKNNLTYLDESIEYLPETLTYILALDNDKPGNNLRDELARRLGYENCKTVIFKDCKDANECLMKYGPTGISESLKEAKEYPIVGLFNAEDIRANIMDFYNNGLPKGDGIGIGEFDMYLRFQPGYLTVITGIPGHGKSEFLDFLLCRLNISNGWKFGLYSPENHPLELHFSKFAEKIIGKPFEGNGKMSPIDLNNMIDYHSKNFYFINPEENFTSKNILDYVKILIRKHGIKGFVIDAWNKLDHQYTTTETKYISEELDRIVVFCEKNGVHCFLVAHPTKIQKDKQTGLYEVPNLYSISGSANFYNKTANGITVYRNFENFQTEVYIQKVKFKHWGQTGCVHFGWDKTNGRYYRGQPTYDSWINSIDSINAVQNNDDFLLQGSDLITGINDNEVF